MWQDWKRAKYPCESTVIEMHTRHKNCPKIYSHLSPVYANNTGTCTCDINNY